jgi:hypothetical protein
MLGQLPRALENQHGLASTWIQQIFLDLREFPISLIDHEKTRSKGASLLYRLIATAIWNSNIFERKVRQDG